MKLVMGFMRLVTGHEKLVTGHDKKLNFLKTGHQIDWSGWSRAGHDRTGHKSLKTRIFLDFGFPIKIISKNPNFFGFEPLY
jgi:hypothetical protein